MRLPKARFSLFALLVAGVLAALMAGCSDADRSPSITGEIPTPAISPTATPTPSPTPGLPSPLKLHAERLASEREWLAQTDYAEQADSWAAAFQAADARADENETAARTALAELADARADEVQALTFQVVQWRALSEQSYEAGWNAGYCTAMGFIDRVEPELAEAISVTIPEGC